MATSPTPPPHTGDDTQTPPRARTLPLNAGDYDEVARISRRYAVAPSEADGFDRYMVRERNALWLPRLEDDLRGGGAVVMVGAGHLPGPGGLIDLLRRDGYDVQPVALPAAPR